MKSNSTAIRCLVIIATVLGLGNGWALLSGTGTRLAAGYERQISDLEKKLKNALPATDRRRQAEYVQAREAEAAALEALIKAQQRMGTYGQAQALVAHAKGKWIGDARKGLKKAQEALKNAEDKEARKAVEKEIKKWEKNLKEGEAALAERQAALDEATRDKPKADRALKQAQDGLAAAKARTMKALQDLGLEKLLQSDAHDGPLARYIFLTEATPRGLAAFAEKGSAQQKFIEDLLDDTDLLVQIAVADGAKGGDYSRALGIYHAIQQASTRAGEGTLQRLALAIALEHAVPVSQRNAVADTDAPDTVDPVKRYLQYEKAFLDKQLDPAFKRLTIWDMRMVVDGEESDEIIEWGRRMLRNYRPDHITAGDYRWRYVALVRSDVPYGSQDNKYDRDDLHFFQNILMNGGVCGRRAFIGRFILRAFGIPTTARPQKGHAALVHWTPDGWVACLGAGWGNGWTKTAYKDDRDFLATTQARATGAHYLRVQRAYWIGRLMGEKRSYGLFEKREPEFWNGVALYTQRALIESAKAKTLEAVGEDIAEASDTNEVIEIAEVEITEQDRKVHADRDGVITIPAAATSEPTGNGGGIIFMPSVLGGKQLHYSRGGRRDFEYTFQAPSSGKYALRARLVTPSWRQNLMLTVNRADEPIKIPLPHTVGLWDFTEPVAVELKNGRNVLHFSRTTDGSAKGFSIKDFTLTPWDVFLNESGSSAADTTAKAPEMSPAHRQLLGNALLADLVRIYADDSVEPLPMDLTVIQTKVKLVKAKGSGILYFQSLDGGKTAAVALEDLPLEDHGLISRLVARLRPDDADAHARVGAYMKALGESALADAYDRKAGSDAVGRLAAELENAGQ